jgi:pyruvate formate lyase activating enzyme
MTPLTGRILHLQRLSTEDGPGLRTTVFFKGCPLHCAWCHNPESIAIKPQTQWFAVRCLGCNTCLEACPNNCLTRTEAGLVIDRLRCQGSGACAEACPSGAIELLGKTMTVDELLSELLKDRAYFEVPAFSGGEKSGGGVTLSGGEPTLQADFVEALLRGLKAQGISTALDTCGLCTPTTLDRLLPFTDLVLYDLKLYDTDLHRQFTGSPNRQILDNLLHLRDVQHRQPFQLWIRTPLIPEATSTAENLSALGRFLADQLDGSLSRWELCAFNNLCRDQYTRLDLEWAYAQTPLMTADELARCEQIAKTSGINPEIVLATGVTRMVEPL